MTDTAPQTKELVTNTVAPDAADVHKGPENVQPAAHVTSTKALPLTDAENPPKTTNGKNASPVSEFAYSTFGPIPQMARPLQAHLTNPPLRENLSIPVFLTSLRVG